MIEDYDVYTISSLPKYFEELCEKMLDRYMLRKEYKILYLKEYKQCNFIYNNKMFNLNILSIEDDMIHNTWCVKNIEYLIKEIKIE